jgi:hypothetical protein
LELSELGDLGDLIGGVAVVVSLIYLSFQIRRNTNTVRASTFQASVDSLSDFTAMIASDAEVAQIYASGLLGTEELSRLDTWRFQFLMVTIIRRLESAFFQRQSAVLNEQQWIGFRHTASILLTSTGGRAYWQSNRDAYTQTFQEWVEQIQLTADGKIDQSDEVSEQDLT